MIIVRISGGLGNQMFQHAAGVALASHHACDLKWDLSWFDGNTLHQGFELSRVFGISKENATAADYRETLGWRGNDWLRGRLASRKWGWLRPKHYIREPHFHYWPKFWQIRPPVYLDGYWQTAKYFQDMEALVRNEFQFSQHMSLENRAIAEIMEESNSVSLHVRRGDYVSDKRIANVHGVCGLDYYLQALDELEGRVRDPYYFVFSDDPQWVLDNMRLEGRYMVVEHNQGVDSYNDMRLMGLCDNHIIANSSFSWWGAWLGCNLEKVVIAPNRWFNDFPADARDLYDPTWILI